MKQTRSWNECFFALVRTGSGRRRAFALTEALLLIIVVMITIGGVFSSIAYGVRLRRHSQADLDSYLAAQSFFEALEAEDPSQLENQNDMDAAALNAVQSMGGGEIEAGRYHVRIFELSPRLDITEGGERFVRVVLDVRKPEADGGAARRFFRDFSARSTTPVRDSAYKRRVRQ